MARGKLLGKHPVDLLVADLERNPREPFAKMRQACVAVARGKPGDARHDIQGDDLDVHRQVAVLIDLATDPASLARHWRGLNLWA